MEPPSCHHRRRPLRAPFLCHRGLFLGLLFLQGSVLFKVYAVDVEVKDDENVTCLYAKWMMNLSITYESAINEYKSVAFMFPESVRYDGSTCGNETYGPILAMEFGNGHLWSIQFTKTEATYQGSISFTYNTNDTELFPDAIRKGPVTTSASFPEQPVQLYTIFRCHNMEPVESDNVTHDLWNVTLQAFLEDGALSNQWTVCENDIVVTAGTPAPTTRPVTENPTTSTVPTTPLPPLPTLLPVEVPATGNYSLMNGSTACLLANLGLQLNISQQVPLIINFNPKSTVASGSCGSTTSVLTLKDGSCTVDFLFAVKDTSSDRFSLKEVNITVVQPKNGTLSAANRSLDYWETTLGNSYMCRKEETLVVTSGYRMNVFDLKIQPFDVQDNEYATAEECSSSDLLIVIPIVVGVLVGLLIIVLFVCYMIGRRKSQSGYQSV
ncbi:lysosome-associated membrane glycoprotein 2 isoform X3 [Pogona vitticeps]